MVRYGEEAQYGDQNDEEARRQQLKSSCLPASQCEKPVFPKQKPQLAKLSSGHL